MSKLIEQIAQWLGVDAETARAVQDEMATYWGSDFSEDSEQELRSTARMAYNEMKLLGAA